MKRFILILLALMSLVILQARNPVGYYYVKYVVYNNNGKTDLSKSERTLYLEKDKLTVLNTPQGRKNWELEYLGLVNLSRYNNFAFHKYYLINKNVYFYVSDERMIEGYNRHVYYLIEFDGQVQLADT